MEEIVEKISKISLKPDSTQEADVLGFEDIEKLLNGYIQYCNEIDNLNKKTKGRKIRRPNFPSEISENIVKFCCKKRNLHYEWNIKGGDLFDKKNNIKIEIKGFTSTGPNSFGPKESWKILYFVDGLDFRSKKFKIYRINYSNESDEIRHFPISKKNNYGEIADKNQRGRLRFKFAHFKKYLGDKCELIFDGSFESLK